MSVRGTRAVESEWRDGPAASVRSVQRIALGTSETAFAYWGQPCVLERLLRRYFSIAERSAGRLVRVSWEHGGPVIRVRWLGVPLIVMGQPRLYVDARRHAIGVPILGGLVACANPGAELRIVLTHRSPEVLALVELDAYRPRAGQIKLFNWTYRQTQARLHALVGRRFLRDLARRWDNPGSFR